ncbi:unnamed protein product [Chrysoparadoxa australica]
MGLLHSLQSKLEFAGCTSPQFRSNTGLGRIAVAAFGLGIVLGMHLTILVYLVAQQAVAAFRGEGALASSALLWCIHIVSLTMFHFMEFFTTALFKPESVSYDAFIINHSTMYTAAILAAWAEFWLESWLFPTFKPSWAGIAAVGLVLVVLGQSFRVSAMWTCQSHFNHQIMVEKEEQHRLVTHGVYTYLRHPSYFGWFWWSVGTQVLLLNPVCVVGYAVSSWSFFNGRIPFEEDLLREFYPDEYQAYMNRTYIGIPFIVNDRRPQGGDRASDPSLKKQQ